MLNYRKIILSTTLAMAIIAPTAVFAGPLKADTPNYKISVCEKECTKSTCKMDMKQNKDDSKCCKKDDSKCCKKDDSMCNKKDELAAKLEIYNKTLKDAEKIVPGTTAKGEVVLKQSKQLKNQIKEIKKEKTQAAILPLKKEFKIQITAIELKVAKGEITDKNAKDQLLNAQQIKKTEVKNIKKQFESQNKPEKQAIKVKKDAVSESFKNFTIAVKSKNAKTIENTFNIYLQNLNKLNGMLSQLISHITV
ncbi:hypothetical protein LGK95_11150 [Clostridium algoriphilum]|uniref:hypothetical protein n=1 Tax=Clostridium algoriphilum TaxID=198347 RepID=UPI001CF16177|nr:hypothetical protein [Clostridium algoriphilum]MCB2294076.1 hypothetical protein [Clostridium algoriphilum]